MSGGDRRPDGRLVLADVFIARGDPYEAIDLLSSTLDEGITAESVYAKLAITYVWIGEFDKAEEVLRGFEDTDDLGLLLASGRLALSRELWGEARSWFERALLADPTNPMIKLNLGNIAMAEGRLTEAENFLKEAVARNPGSFEGWNGLGIVSARQRDAEGAIAAWQRAHQINPEFIGVLFNLGLAHAQAGQPVAGDRLFRGLRGPRRAGSAAGAGARHGPTAENPGVARPLSRKIGNQGRRSRMARACRALGWSGLASIVARRCAFARSTSASGPAKSTPSSKWAPPCVGLRVNTSCWTAAASSYRVLFRSRIPRLKRAR